MKVAIISVVIILISIMSVALILGFDSISVVRYDTYFQPVVAKPFLDDVSFVISRLNENLNSVPVLATYDVAQTLYQFVGYGVVVPNNLSLDEYFDSNSELIAVLVRLSDSDVYVNSHKRYDKELPSVVLYNDFTFIHDFRVKITRSEGGTYYTSLYSSPLDNGYYVPLDVINIIQPFNSAVLLNEYDKPVLDNSEGGLNGIFKTLDFILIEYPVYLYNYVDRYISFI